MRLLPVRYQRHIFVCVNERQDGECCAKKDSMEILKALREHVNMNGLMNKYNITKTKCLGHCEEGPTVAVYPDGKIFVSVTVADAREIIEKFLD